MPLSLQNMSIQDAETQVMNEQEINDLMNSVIDWGTVKVLVMRRLEQMTVKMRTMSLVFVFGWLEHCRHHHALTICL